MSANTACDHSMPAASDEHLHWESHVGARRCPIGTGMAGVVPTTAGGEESRPAGGQRTSGVCVRGFWDVSCEERALIQ